MAKKKKRLICNVHDDIMDLSGELEELLEGEVGKRILNKVKKVYDLASEAKEYGQAMEDRLSLYRSAVEELGFSRDK